MRHEWPVLAAAFNPVDVRLLVVLGASTASLVRLEGESGAYKATSVATVVGYWVG